MVAKTQTQGELSRSVILISSERKFANKDVIVYISIEVSMKGSH